MAAPENRVRVLLSETTRVLARFGPPAVIASVDRSKHDRSMYARLALLVLGAGALSALQWGRQAGGFPNLWAEDGVLFVQDALRHGLVENVTTPAGGYVIVLSRLLAQIVVLFPLERAPMVIAVCGITVTTSCALWIYHTTGQWLANPLLRVVVAASIVVVPLDIGGGELFGTILDLQWPLLFTLFWTLIFVPRGRIETFAAVGVAAIASVTTGLVVVLLPLAIIMVCVRRQAAQQWFPAGVAIAGSLIQISAHFIHPHNQALGLGNAHSTTVAGWVDIVTVRMLGQAFLGAHLTSRLWFDLRGWADILCLLPLVPVLVVGARHATPRTRWLIAASLCTAVAIAVVPLVVRPGLAAAMRPQIINGQAFFAGARYMYCPMLLTVTAAVAAADALRLRGAFIGRVAVIVTIIAVAVVAAAAYRLPAIRDGVPSWKAQFSTARRHCRAPGAEVIVAPDATWKLLIPCDRLK